MQRVDGRRESWKLDAARKYSLMVSAALGAKNIST